MQEQQHILGHRTGQPNTGIKACIVINKQENDIRCKFKTAQKAMGKVMHDERNSKSGQQQKQQILPSPTK
jgi:hypothetical protein